MMDAFLRFFDVSSFLIVFAGAAIVAALRATNGDVGRAWSALKPLCMADPDADRLAAISAIGKIKAITEVRDIATVDRVRTAEKFLRRAARHLAQAPSPEAFARWAEQELAQRERRHQGVIAYWRSIAEAAPGMGMIGTVAGLIQMFSAIDDVGRIGPAMALAMLTTLYGIVLATVIAGPIATRLERLSEIERAWQREALDRMLDIAIAELAPTTPRLRKVS